MKQINKIIIAFFSFVFVYTAQAAPGKTFFYNNEIIASNDVQYFTKSMKELPVKTAWVKKQVVMSWQTITEVNTVYFEIQRSFNGKDYETIESIPAHSITKNISAYSFVDSKNENRRGQSYYRLKAVFSNGESTFTIGVKAKKTGVFDMNQSYAEAVGLAASK